MLKENWRRRPDLNRGWRFCRPLPYHLATAPSERLEKRRTDSSAGRVIRTTALDEAGQFSHNVTQKHAERSGELAPRNDACESPHTAPSRPSRTSGVGVGPHVAESAET